MLQPGELEVDPGPVKVAEVERHPQLLLAGAGVGDVDDGEGDPSR